MTRKPKYRTEFVLQQNWRSQGWKDVIADDLLPEVKRALEEHRLNQPEAQVRITIRRVLNEGVTNGE